MHAAALAKEVGIPTVLVPERPGVFSAVGLVMADIRHDFVQTRIARGADITAACLGPLYAGLDAEAREALARDGVPEADRRLRRSADFRYLGQAYEVNVPVPEGEVDARTIETIVQGFHDLHKQLYAHNHPDKPVELVSGRVAGIGLTSAPPLKGQARQAGPATPKEHRPVYFDEAADFVDTAVYDRDGLAAGASFEGPAIVEQLDTTTVIHPGQRAEVDELGNLLIQIGE
jgi:N-methylhydantoinase A